MTLETRLGEKKCGNGMDRGGDVMQFKMAKMDARAKKSKDKESRWTADFWTQHSYGVQVLKAKRKIGKNETSGENGQKQRKSRKKGRKKLYTTRPKIIRQEQTSFPSHCNNSDFFFPRCYHPNCFFLFLHHKSSTIPIER